MLSLTSSTGRRRSLGNHRLKLLGKHLNKFFFGKREALTAVEVVSPLSFRGGGYGVLDELFLFQLLLSNPIRDDANAKIVARHFLDGLHIPHGEGRLLLDAYS